MENCINALPCTYNIHGRAFIQNIYIYIKDAMCIRSTRVSLTCAVRSYSLSKLDNAYLIIITGAGKKLSATVDVV